MNTLILKNILGLYRGHTDILTHKQKIFFMPKKLKRIYFGTVCTTIKSEIKHTRELYKLLSIKKEQGMRDSTNATGRLSITLLKFETCTKSKIVPGKAVE